MLLAPLAGIGNWFVRLQARRHGAGLAVSEMVSSFGLHHRNERTLRELLRIHPDEHPVSIQLFGQDPEVMRSAAAIVAEAGADLIDINMGCPVRKVCKTGAGASLLADPELALEIARGAIEGGGVPVTVKLRSGLEPGGRSGLRSRAAAGRRGGGGGDRLPPALRRHPSQGDAGLRAGARAGRARSTAPMIISGGLGTTRTPRARVRGVRRGRGDDRPRRLGNPWIFEELTGRREPSRRPRARSSSELLWVIDRAEEHLGPERAARYLRKFYPWYLERLDAGKPAAAALQQSEDLDRAREAVRALAPAPALT